LFGEIHLEILFFKFLFKTLKENIVKRNQTSLKASANNYDPLPSSKMTTPWEGNFSFYFFIERNIIWDNG